MKRRELLLTSLLVSELVRSGRTHPSVAATEMPGAPCVLTIGGDGATGRTEFTTADLLTLPQHEITAIVRCTCLRGARASSHHVRMELDDGALCDATWTGPRLHDVLKRAGIRPEASEIMIRDTSATPSDMASETPASLPIKRALAADTIIALSLIGAEIPVDLACFPLIITPGLVANNGRNSFNDLEIRTARPDSRLPDDNSNLYAVITDIPLNARATSHRDGDRVRGAGFSLSGLAWDNGAGIDRVEISINDGQNWGRAMMERSPGRFAFQPWRMQVTASPGSFTIFIRAIGKLGIWQDKPGASLTAQQQISPTQVLKLVAQ